MGSGSAQGQVGENDSGDIILREMEDRGVMCDGIVEGSSTPPSLFISINDQDMTHFFVAAEEAKVGLHKCLHKCLHIFLHF